jgi:predicted DNA-binding helix-hairpin-helix protein
MVQIAMGQVQNRLTEAKEKGDRFAPAGQSTQMIVGAAAEADAAILEKASGLYTAYGLRRVYYSGYSPILHADPSLPAKCAPLVREHRLYQADWLMRFYGFQAPELTTPETPNLSLKRDPKLDWALRNRDFFPVDVNRAGRAALLRVPGLGVRNVNRILKIRKHRALRLDDLAKLRVAVDRARYFIVTADHNSAVFQLDSIRLPVPEQLPLFEATVQGEL